MDSEKEEFVGNSEVASRANELLTRRYREPFVVPDKV